jgi:hypothetical protein
MGHDREAKSGRSGAGPEQLLTLQHTAVITKGGDDVDSSERLEQQLNQGCT